MSAVPDILSGPREQKSELGFWVYLMTDCVLFGSLFATYAVLRNNTFGGPGGADIFNMPLILISTLILLTSSFLCGLGLLAARAGHKKRTLVLFGATMLCGIAFLSLEMYEFSKLVSEGFDWQRSAFLSVFFTLVATHGAHIFFGLVWMAVMMVLVARRGLGVNTVRRLNLLALFWHFLDVVWIFIFSIVYLMGVAA